ncbi:MAG: T9SS type A sorting domain-containing protein [Candidatus Cloacimonetes bacterium]|nr:T9SS type A sorting domain-containing protein [Candidatus Cloacimonadota bacterium]
MRAVLSILLILFAGALFAASATQSDEQTTSVFQVTSQTLNDTELQFNLDNYQTQTINQRGELFQRFSHPQAVFTSEAGFAELPMFSTLVAVPGTGRITVEKISSNTEVISNINLYPSQGIDGEPEGTQFVKNDEYYNTGAMPEAMSVRRSNIITASEPVLMRDLRLINVSVSPFEYNPVTRELTVHSDVQVRVTRTAEQGINEISIQRPVSRGFDRLYSALIPNYATTRDRDIEFQARSILIIHPDDAALLPDIDTFVNWKQQKGFIVNTASTDVSEAGSTTGSIHSYIQNAYDNWEIPPEYIILLGDANGGYDIPEFRESYSNYNGEGDLPYTFLSGGDTIPDIFIGRIPIDNPTDMLTYLAKINIYERMPNLIDLNMYNHTLLTGDTSPSGLSCVLTCKHTQDLILWHDSDHTFTELYAANPSPTSMNNALNSGALWFIYRGWIGMSGWGSSHISSMTNNNMLVNAVILTCSTGSFASSSDAATELLMKAGTPSMPKGSIFSIGMATSGTHTQYNNALTQGIMHGVYKDNMPNMGEALVRGEMNLYLSYWNVSGGQSYVNRFNHWCNLMGDPTCDVWRAEPLGMNVSWVGEGTGVIPFGQNYIDVTVTDDNGALLQDAWVTFRQGNNAVFGTDYTDEYRHVLVTFDPSQAQTDLATLTVTKLDYVPQLIDVSMTGGGIATLWDLSIDDDTQVDSNGNGDGQANPGEQIEMNVALENRTDTAMLNMHATLRTSDPFVTIIDSLTIYPTIYINGHNLANQDFVLAIASEAPNGYTIEFTLDVVNDATQFVMTFWMDVTGGHLDITNIAVNDGGNSKLDPGESSPFEIELTNNTPHPVSEVYGIISPLHSYIYAEDAHAYFGTIPAGNSVSCTTDPFGLRASSQLYSGMEVELEVFLYNDQGYNEYQTFLLSIGDNSTTNQPSGPDAYGYICLDNTDTGYAEAPVYNWIEINPSQANSLPGTNTGLVDTGNEDSSNGWNSYIDFFSLPFDFKFYGETYDNIGITTKGFVTFEFSGSNWESHDPMFRNWRIPGPGGTSPMIAPFWDSIYLGTGAGIYTYYYAAEHVYIVEWFNTHNSGGGSGMTFQLLLYDPAYRATPQGDGLIKFQYQSFSNPDGSNSQSGNQGNYATIGIESHTATEGIEYSYCNSYIPGGATLGANTALLFTGIPQSHDDAFVDYSSSLVWDPNGNSNAVLDPNETADIVVNLMNTGFVPAHNVQVNLTTSNPDITINSANANYGVIPPQGIVQQPFNVTVAPGAATGLAAFTVSIISDNAPPHTRIFNLEIGSTSPATFVVITGNVALNPPAAGILTDVVVSATDYGTHPDASGDYVLVLPLDSYTVTARLPFFAADEVIVVITVPGTTHPGNDLSLEYLVPAENLIAIPYGDTPQTGVAELDWNYTTQPGFSHFDVFRNRETGPFVKIAETIVVEYDDTDIILNTNYHYYITTVYNEGTSDSTSHAHVYWYITDEQEAGQVPAVTELHCNYPNPFNPETTIAFSLKQNADVRLKVYNIRGELVKTLADKPMEAGSHSITWRGQNNSGKQVSSGVYFYRLDAGNYHRVRKAVLLK